jgi:tetratricopeptide (TPR) repeat protein
MKPRWLPGETFLVFALAAAMLPASLLSECSQSPASAPGTIKMTVQPLSPALLHARDLYRGGNFPAAIAEYNALIAGGGADVAGAYAGLARVYLKQKNPAAAYSAAQKAVELGPHLAAAHSALGEVYFRQGKLVDAEREFQIPLKENIADARIFLGLSRISRATSNYRTSKSTLDDAHGIDPGDPEIRRYWFSTLSIPERMKAIQEYLAGRTNDDDKTLDGLERSLVVLRDEITRPERGCQLKTKITATQTGLEALHTDARRIRGYGLKVKLNDATAHLLLDTGATGIVVNSKIAEKAGIHSVVQQKLGGIGDKGAAGGFIGFVESIQVGDLEFENCYVDVVDSKKSVPADGLIGADVFSHFLVDIDFPDEKFKLSELPKLTEQPAEAATLDTHIASTYHLRDRYIAPEMKSYTQIFRFGHMLLIPVSVNDHPYKLFLIDTGSFDNTITPDAARESTKIYSDSNLHVTGLSGQVKEVYLAEDVSLAFAHFKQRKTIVAFDLKTVSDSAGTEVSGTLGFGMLYMLDIRIDFRDGLVQFTYDDRRRH